MHEYAHGVFFFPEIGVLNWNTDHLRMSPEFFNLIVDKYEYKSFDVFIYEHLGPMFQLRKDTKGLYPLQFNYKGEVR